MVLVPRFLSDEQVLEMVEQWVDALAREEYAAVFSALGYALAFGQPGPACIRGEIERYRSPRYFPGVEHVKVSDWRTALGGNPAPVRQLTWYKPNDLGLAGAVAFDLPINGKWSDLEADFVLFENKDNDTCYILSLEEIGCSEQRQREFEEWEAGNT